MIRVPGRPASIATTAALILTAFVVDARAQAPAAAATSLNPRVLLGAAALLVTGLLFLLYFYRPRLYIRSGSSRGRWPRLLHSSSPIATPARRPRMPCMGCRSSSGILSALVFVVSADAYRTTAAAAARLRGRAASRSDLVRARTAGDGPVDGARPGAPDDGRRFRAAGFAYLALVRQTRLLGAAVVGTMMLAFALANTWWLALGGHASMRPVGSIDVPQPGALSLRWRSACSS